MATKIITADQQMEEDIARFDKAIELERTTPVEERPERMLAGLERLGQASVHQLELLDLIAKESNYEKIDALIAAARAIHRESAREIEGLDACAASLVGLLKRVAA